MNKTFTLIFTLYFSFIAAQDYQGSGDVYDMLDSANTDYTDYGDNNADGDFEEDYEIAFNADQEANTGFRAASDTRFSGWIGPFTYDNVNLVAIGANVGSFSEVLPAETLGCTVYQPSKGWGYHDWQSICHLVNSVGGIQTDCQYFDDDRHGGLCANTAGQSMILGYEHWGLGQSTGPDIWASSATFVRDTVTSNDCNSRRNSNGCVFPSQVTGDCVAVHHTWSVMVYACENFDSNDKTEAPPSTTPIQPGGNPSNPTVPTGLINLVFGNKGKSTNSFDSYMTHGCYCPMLIGNSGHQGVSLDAIDTICSNWVTCTANTCDPNGLYDVIHDNGNYVCQSQGDACALAQCQCDLDAALAFGDASIITPVQPALSECSALVNECASNNGGCAHDCTDLDSGFECSCRSGYYQNGPNCNDIDECALNTDNCEHNCSNTGGGFTCSCRPGYSQNGPNCNEIDECAQNTDNCEHNCSNTDGGFTCSCRPGYSQNANHCNEIDECANGSSGCAQNCANNDGGYTCSCRSGFTLNSNGHGCDDINECNNGSNGFCEQTCTNRVGDYVCGCNVGYDKIDDFNCRDIDECASNNGGCAQNCNNNEGSYFCTCDAGYLLNSVDQHSCVNVNECETNKGGCNQICTDTVGSYVCSCRPNWRLGSDDHTCADIDECAEGTDGCEHDCTNVTPDQVSKGYSCSCKDGYRLAPNEHSCPNINECEEGSDWCEHQCHDLPGTFYCSCERGWELDQLSEQNGIVGGCKDVDECRGFYVDNGGCDHDCTNTIGSYECSCQVGYSLDGDRHTCNDIDECATENGGYSDLYPNRPGCDQDCTNTVGNFFCTCRRGWALRRDDYSCKDVDECAGIYETNGGCEHNCANSIGSYSCSCRQTGWDLDADNHACNMVTKDHLYEIKTPGLDLLPTYVTGELTLQPGLRSWMETIDKDQTAEMADYGCWCQKPFGMSQIGGEAVDIMDHSCKNWQKCHRCTMMTSPTCVDGGYGGFTYYVQWTGDEPECSPRNTPCTNEFCECNIVWVQEVMLYLEGQTTNGVHSGFNPDFMGLSEAACGVDQGPRPDPIDAKPDCLP